MLCLSLHPLSYRYAVKLAVFCQPFRCFAINANRYRLQIALWSRFSACSFSCSSSAHRLLTHAQLSIISLMLKPHMYPAGKAVKRLTFSDSMKSLRKQIAHPPAKIVKTWVRRFLLITFSPFMIFSILKLLLSTLRFCLYPLRPSCFSCLYKGVNTQIGPPLSKCIVPLLWRLLRKTAFLLCSSFQPPPDGLKQKPYKGSHKWAGADK